jgi:3'-phosphoadenosine 5'-phosphosulfate sulfotransferase (PAPS reductase)/FAD synthetase
MLSKREARHILSLSGGKDSSALAIYLGNKIPDIEYVFCDTKKELPETYEYIDKLEVFLGKKIERLAFEGGDFDDLLNIYNGYLPSSQSRWCTKNLKIKPFEKFIGEDICYSYIGIRADEQDRIGYISTKQNIIPKYPFIEDGIVKEDVFRILIESGIGFPEYYKWRSRSGCYFCFFQQKIEWVGLLEHHPELFISAKNYEKTDCESEERFTWTQNESLEELQKPERIQQIKKNFDKKKNSFNGNTSLKKNLESILLDVYVDEDNESCLVCHL